MKSLPNTGLVYGNEGLQLNQTELNSLDCTFNRASCTILEINNSEKPSILHECLWYEIDM